MKIFQPPNIGRFIKTTVAVVPFVVPTLATNNFKYNQPLCEDEINISFTAKDTTEIIPQGTTNQRILDNAPNPTMIVEGELQKAKFVIDLSQNALYSYDDSGKPMCAYLVASGKKSTPTDTGARIVTHVETYPYRSAPKSTKRYKNPNDYGPRIICLRKLDLVTGKTSPTGEFIHGNRNPLSLGKYASKGCIRMDNNVIKYLASTVKKGDLVYIQE